MSDPSIDATIKKLTVRRRQVLEQLLLGASDANIAITLGISESTVRKHIERICEFFAQELTEQHEKGLKRADLIRIVAGQRPEMTISHYDLKDEAKHLNKKGFDAYLEGNFAIAAQYFQAAIALDEQSCDARYNLGIIYEMLHRKDKAKHHYQIASQLEGDGAYASICNLARLNILAGKPQESILALQDCLTKDVKDVPTQVSIYKNLGWAFYLLGKYDEALEHLNQAIALSSTSTASYCLMAQVFEKTGHLSQAKDCWIKCLAGSQLSDDQSESPQKSWQWPEIEIWQAQAFQFLHTHTELN